MKITGIIALMLLLSSTYASDLVPNLDELLKTGLPAFDARLDEGYESEPILKKVIGSKYKRRRIRLTRKSPFLRVGLVGGYCSGTLISDRHVLTAAHCVWNAKVQTWMDTPYFVPGKEYTKNPFGVFNWKKIFINKKYQKFGDTNYDYAVIELREPIGRKIGYMGVMPPVDQPDFHKNVLISGYPGDKRFGTIWSVACPVKVFGKQAKYKCNTYGGMSGSSLQTQLKVSGNLMPMIFGVHTYGTKTMNGGTYINRDVFTHLVHWISNRPTPTTTVRVNKNPSLNPSKHVVGVTNRCKEDLQFAAHFRDKNGQWQTYKELKTIPAGETKYMFYSTNNNYFFYARTASGSRVWSGNDTATNKLGSNGKVYNFKQHVFNGDTPNTRYEQIFDCSSRRNSASGSDGHIK